MKGRGGELVHSQDKGPVRVLAVTASLDWVKTWQPNISTQGSCRNVSSAAKELPGQTSTGAWGCAANANCPIRFQRRPRLAGVSPSKARSHAIGSAPHLAAR